MTKLIDFRSVNEYEKSIIKNSISKLSLKSDMFIEKFKDKLYISFDRALTNSYYPSIYLLCTEHINLIKKVEIHTKITSAGLYFGFIKKDTFLISLEGTEFLENKKYLSKDQLLIIDNNGEKSILYGNDIKKGNMVKYPSNFNKGDFIVVYNLQNEILAIGKWLIDKEDLKMLNSDVKVALNFVDKGYYLRKNQ